MPSVFVVFRQGVYRHECGGVFLTLDQAISAAVEHIKTEKDEYHTYTVHEFEIGVPIKWELSETPDWVDPELIEPPAIATVERYATSGVHVQVHKNPNT